MATSRVVSIVNRKGGAGKSTSAIHIARCSAIRGLRVLLIDTDAQTEGLTYRMGAYAKGDQGRSLYDTVVLGDPLKPLIRDAADGVDLVPGGPLLGGVDGALYGQGDPVGARRRLADAIADAPDEWDLIIIDTPPSGTASMSRMAIRAARHVLVPVGGDGSGIAAMSELGEEIGAARKDGGSAEILGVFLFRADRGAPKFTRQLRQDLIEYLDGAAPLLESAIRDVTAAAGEGLARGTDSFTLAEQQQKGMNDLFKALREGRKPPGKLSGSHAGLASDYYGLTREVLALIAARETDPDATSEPERASNEGKVAKKSKKKGKEHSR